MNRVLSVTHRLRISLLAIPVALLSFTMTQSWQILNPTYFGYLWGSGDIASSFSSWLYFRQSDLLQWPLTANPHLGTPWFRTILFTDTPPILALPLKFLSAGLSADFQFTGIQILVSTYLIVYFTSKCLEALRVGQFSALAGGLLVSTAPFLIFRDEFHHYSLNVIWVISAAVFLALRMSNRFPTWGWSALFFVSLTWMPYFAAPVAMIWLPSLIITAPKFNRRWSAWVRDITLPLAAVVLALIVDGFWFNAGPSGDFGVGYYNANLLSLINPLATPVSNWSQVIPGTPNATEGQYEGFAFLGIGGLVIVASALALLLLHPQLIRAQLLSPRARVLMVAALLGLVAATGLSFDVGPFRLLSISMPEEIASALSILRSSGRFMLLVAIVTLIWGIAILGRSFRNSLVLTVVVAAVALTYLDSWSGVERNRAQQRDQPQWTDGTLKAGDFLDRMRVERVTFVVPEDSAYGWKMDTLAATARRNLPTNDAFAARPNLDRLTEERDRVTALFLTGRIARGDAWVVYPEFASTHSAQMGELLQNHCWTRIADAYLIASGQCP